MRVVVLSALVAFVAFVALSMSGCPSEVNPDGGGCGPDQECADGLACQDGACIARCDDGGDCQRGACDLASGLCVDCLRTEDCGDGLVCNDFTNRCVEPVLGCTSDGECDGLRCDTIKGACVECLSEGDCEGGALCDFITQACVLQQSCVTDGDCTDSVCDPVGRTCVECYNPAHCASGVCDSLSLTCVAGCEDDDATEPNGGAAAATLAPGGAHEGGICPGDVDEFVVQVGTAGGFDATVAVTLTVDGGAALQVRLLNAGGSLVAGSTPAGSGATIDAAGVAPGAYRLVVSAVNDGDAGDYLLAVEVDIPVVCEQLDDEPNDSTANAPTIAADNALHPGSICGADTDLFEFNATAGEDIEAAVIAGDGAGTVALAILSSTGSVLVTGNPATLEDVAAAGTFYLRVTATGGDATYSVRVNATDAPPVCNQTDAEPNDLDAQALSLTPGSARAGTICPGDVDQHRFAATALDDATVTISGGAGLSARLVRAADGVQVATGLFMNVADLDAGGYRVVVQGANASTQATYSVNVQLAAEPVPDVCDEGDIEPDARTVARDLALDGTPQAGRICASDTDFFTFTLPFASTVTIHARFVDAAGDLDMRLTDSAGGLIATSAGVTDDEIIVRNLAAGTYGVEMFGFLGALNTYTMEATLQGCTPDDGFEVNNTFSQATPVAGSLVSAARCPGDDDFFLVRLESGDSVIATLAGAGLTMSLLSAVDGTVVVNDSASGANRRIQINGLPAGRYVFRVTGSGADRVAYTLNPSIAADPSRCIDDGAHPNDTSATAFPLDDDGILDGSYDVGALVSCALIDADWFSIALPGQKQITLQMSFNAPSSDVDIELLEPRAATGLTRTIARSVATDKQDRVSGMINAGGTYLVRAIGFDDLPTPYGIGIEVSDPPASSCVDDKFDTWSATQTGAATADRTFTNDLPTNAVTVSSGESFNALRVCPSNADWLKVNAAVGQRVIVHVDYTHAAGRDIDVRLYGPANQTTPVASSIGTDGTEDITFTATAAGDHFVEVFGFQNGENVYDLDLTVE